MERLIPITPDLPSTDEYDIVVGISGFGSGKADPSRWTLLADMTGRTAFNMHYDAQDLPFPAGTALPPTFRPLPALLIDLKMRWDRARKGGKIAAEYLAGWLRRWTEQDRRVLVIGFSLGGYVAWEAVKIAPSPLIDVVLISAAIGDNPEQWRTVDEIGTLFNLYSSDDMILKYLYPRSVSSDETPAAGLGPLQAPDDVLSMIHSVDVTDIIGKDHFWASSHLPELVRLAIGCYYSHANSLDECTIDLDQAPNLAVPAPILERSLRWMVTDPDLWHLLGLALSGDAEAARRVRQLDEWATSEAASRLPPLYEAGLSSSYLWTFAKTGCGSPTALRSAEYLAGLLRAWIQPGKSLPWKPSRDSASSSSKAGVMSR